MEVLLKKLVSLSIASNNCIVMSVLSWWNATLCQAFLATLINLMVPVFCVFYCQVKLLNFIRVVIVSQVVTIYVVLGVNYCRKVTY